MTITTTKFEKSLIREQVRKVGARRVLEIGAYEGETTRILSETCASFGGRVTVIDPMKWSSNPVDLLERIGGWLAPSDYESRFWKNVRAGGHDNVRLIKGFSNDQRLVGDRDPDLEEFDLIFIDGDHTYPVVSSDLKHWGTRVRSGGRILLHDAIPRFKGVVDAIREYEGDPRLTVIWPEKDTLCVIEVHESLSASPKGKGDSRLPSTA